MNKLRTYLILNSVAQIFFISVILFSWLSECTAISSAYSSGEMLIAPLRFFSRVAILAAVPLALVALFSLKFGRKWNVSLGVISFTLFLIYFSATLFPRAGRASSFPAKSDEMAWQQALTRLQNGNTQEMIGRADGKIIWYVKGFGSSGESFLFAFLLSIPGIGYVGACRLKRINGK